MRFGSRTIFQSRIAALLSISGAILFFIYDLTLDVFFEGELFTLHFFIEVIVFVGVSIALSLGIRDLLILRRRLSREEHRNNMLSRALAESIDIQLEEWHATPSEKDVGWLIIKGFRFSEIAMFRGVKENTTRRQATSLYAKAGVSGRAEFVAEIIQSLLISVPDGAEAASPNSSPPEMLN